MTAGCLREAEIPRFAPRAAVSAAPETRLWRDSISRLRKRGTAALTVASWGSALNDEFEGARNPEKGIVQQPLSRPLKCPKCLLS